MKTKVALTCLLVTICLSTAALWAADDGFTLCKSKYALCTTAKCTPIPGQEGQVACPCDVKTGYSASQTACEDPKETSTGQLKSRYYPVHWYAVCSNSRPWAWCLDKPCTVDKDNPSKATCACTLVKDKGDYVVVTDKYNDSTCTTDIWSSATVQDITQITDFLKTKDQLKPFPIKVLNSQNQK